MIDLVFRFIQGIINAGVNSRDGLGVLAIGPLSNLMRSSDYYFYNLGRLRGYELSTIR